MREDKKELRKKLHDKLLDAVELESKIVPMRKRIAKLEEAQRTDADQMSKLEKRSTERETLLGKVEQDRDKANKELSETATELARVREESNGFKQKVDELELEITRVRGENNELQLEITQVRKENNAFKTKIDELQLEAAQVLTSDFGAVLQKFACKFVDLDLSEFSVYNEVVDGKIMPPT